MARNSQYTRLPGRGGTFYRQSLWLGSDHLLSVINRGYTEDYKRFYYRDVRAIQIRRTSTFTVINTVLGALAGLCVAVQLLGWLVWKWPDSGHIAFGILTFLFVFSFLLNLLLGPTCAVHLYTAVHSEQMTSLSRLRTAGKALRRLQARIESVQGALTQEQATQNGGALESHSLLFPPRGGAH